MRGLLPANDLAIPFGCFNRYTPRPERFLGERLFFSDGGTFLRLLAADWRGNLCGFPPLNEEQSIATSSSA